jgi:hypothetical protein
MTNDATHLDGTVRASNEDQGSCFGRTLSNSKFVLVMSESISYLNIYIYISQKQRYIGYALILVPNMKE